MILLLETVHSEAQALLESVGEPVVLSQTLVPGPNDVDDRVRAIVTRGLGRISADVLSQAPGLRVVARCGAGLDNVDTAAAARAEIPVVHAPGSTSNAVAEHAVMLMLALARRLPELDTSVKAGRWDIREGYEGTEVRGKRLGIVGLGGIGTRIAELARALGMDVVTSSRRDNDAGIPRLPLDQLLRTSDVVQLCAPLTDETRGMIGADQLASLKPGALLVNTARGPLVDHRALGDALDHGPIGGYAADVWDPEPPEKADDAIGHTALTHRRTLVTPHISALTDVTYREICVRTAEAVVAVLTGGEPDARCVYGG